MSAAMSATVSAVPPRSTADVKKFYEGKTPNLGGRTVMKAGDDALKTVMVPLDNILHLVDGMAFMHVWYLYDLYINHLKIEDQDDRDRFWVMLQLAKARNQRLMRGCNVVVEKLNSEKKEGDPDKKPFTIEDPVNLEEVLAVAERLNLDPTVYTDTKNDEREIASCTNKWCLDQLTEIGKAADNVKIVTDLDGIKWLVLIVRIFGPGADNYAFAGGFLNAGETFAAAAEREGDEETEITVDGKRLAGGDMGNDVVVTLKTTVLEKVNIKAWDPRLKFAEFGIEVCGVIYELMFSYKK